MLTHQEITSGVIACAIEVHRTLGPGFLESIYEQALRIEFERRGIKFLFQQEICVSYNAQPVGTHRYDFLVEEKIIVELKAIKALEDVHYSQVRSYLKAWNLEHGLLLNFSSHPLTIKRVLRNHNNLPASLRSSESSLFNRNRERTI